MSSVHNHQENLEIHLEQDSGYDDYVTPQEIIDHLGEIRLVINDHQRVSLPENWFAINVVSDYQGNMSDGQKDLYVLLLEVQATQQPTLLNFESLSRNLELKEYQAIEKRLENLQLIGAITGYPLNPMKLDTPTLSIQSLAEEARTIINDNHDSRIQILNVENKLGELRTKIDKAKISHSLSVNGNKDLKNADARKAALDKVVSEDKFITKLTEQLNKLKYDLEIMKIEMQHGNETMRLNLELIKALGNNSITEIE